MPNAPTHDFITLASAAGANGAYFHYAAHPDPALAALFTAAYLFAGYACAGDLDLDSREYRRWGVLRGLWWPYRTCVPHRSWVSHGLIAGGVIRAAYLAVICTLVFWGGIWLYGRLGPHVDPGAMTRAGWISLVDAARARPQQTAALLSGFILAGTMHSLADFLYSGIKRRL